MKSRHFNFTPPIPQYRLIGHRGVAAIAPENTMAGFKLAAKKGIDWIEFDVQLASDYTLVIFHDDELDRTTDGQGIIYQKSSAELSQLDAGKWFSPAFVGEKIPIFSTALTELLKLDLFLNIELKVPSSPPPGYVALLALIFTNVLRSLWPLDRPKPLISSFDWTLLHAIRASLPEYPVGYLTDNCTYEIIDEVAQLHNVALHCHHGGLPSEMIDYAHSKNLPILVYTANDPVEALRLLKQGVFALFSDDPNQLLKGMSSAL